MRHNIHTWYATVYVLQLFVKCLHSILQSTLLQCLLGEVEPMRGSVEVAGRVSFSSQDPWVFSATLRENILFGLPYHGARYNAVIKACALDKVWKLLKILDTQLA